MATSERLPLWPDGAPRGESAEPRQVPSITPYPVAAGGASRGAVVILPGGGYGGLADHEGEPIAHWLNGHGIAGFVCRYRVSPYRHPCPSLDARRAVRWVRHHAAEYGVDPAKVGILGFSAGGHLASYVATHGEAGDPAASDPIDRQSGRPDCAILCYPVISFEPWSHQGSARNLLGGDPDDAQKEHFSSDRQVSPATPPCFLWHTADDPGVNVENSLRFASACRRHQVPCELHVFPHGRHGLGLASADPHVGQWPELAARWLGTLGWSG